MAFWDILTILSYTIISTSGICLGFHINIKRDRMLLFMGSKSQVACGILISSYPLVKIQPKRKLFSNFRRYSFSYHATNINYYKYCLYILLLCYSSSLFCFSSTQFHFISQTLPRHGAYWEQKSGSVRIKNW